MSGPEGKSADLATVYILIPPSPLFAAHWSFFIPDILGTDVRGSCESDTGRRVHVAGDRLNGFKLEIIRNYNIRQHRGVGSRRFAVGSLLVAKENDKVNRENEVAAGGQGQLLLEIHRYYQGLDVPVEKMHEATERHMLDEGHACSPRDVDAFLSAQHAASPPKSKDEDEGGGYIDNEPRDAFEQICVAVEAPGPSLKSATSEGGRTRKAEVEDCQWWVKQVVSELVAKGLLVASSAEENGQARSPEEAVAGLPVH